MSSKWTDFAENKIADMFRGLPWSLGSSLHAGLASVASDASSTELTGTGYARKAMARALATWSPTQGGGSPVASTGTSHSISNLAAIDFGVAGSAWGTLNAIELWDASTGGNRICYIPVSYGSVSMGDAVVFPIASVALTLGLTGGTSDYLANVLLDLFFRGQAYTWPAETFIAYCTSAPSNSTPGTEVPFTGGYARTVVPSSTTAWSGTQGAGTTGISIGTLGVISNNSPITFPAPTADWGTITHDMQMDAASAGNILFYGQLTSPKTVLSGSPPPSYGSGNYQLTID